MLQFSVAAISLSFLHLLARVARVSEADSGAMPTPCSVKMAGALDAARRLQVVLDKLLGDPWAREALSGLQARLTQVDALADDVAEYVNNQFVTLHEAMASLTPALAPPEAQPEAPDNSAMRATAIVAARVARAASASGGLSKVPNAGSFVSLQSRWADQREEEPGSSSSAWLPSVPEPPHPPPLATRQPPVKAPPAKDPAKAIQAVGNVIPVKPCPATPPQSQRDSGTLRGYPTPLIPLTPGTRTWVAPQVEAEGRWQGGGRSWTERDTRRHGPNVWGSASATSVTRTGEPFWWDHGRPHGWNIIMGDLPADVTADDARASVCSKHDLYVHLFVLARLLTCMQTTCAHVHIHLCREDCRRVCRLVCILVVDMFVDLF